ncbi:MAG: hypothetical protein ACK4M4_09675, partial [Flavobacterium sp.]
LAANSPTTFLRLPKIKARASKAERTMKRTYLYMLYKYFLPPSLYKGANKVIVQHCLLFISLQYVYTI